MRGGLLALGAAALIGWIGPASAQTQIVERSVKAVPNNDTQIGVHINVLPDQYSER